MGRPVEVEFAVNLAPPPGEPKDFGFLQMRPLPLSWEQEGLELEDVEEERLLCRSTSVLGKAAEFTMTIFSACRGLSR